LRHWKQEQHAAEPGIALLEGVYRKTAEHEFGCDQQWPGVLADRLIVSGRSGLAWRSPTAAQVGLVAGPHGGIWRRLHRPREHIGVEHDHSNFIGFAGDLSRVWPMAAMSSSMSPTLRPRAASASPRRTRFAGFTARSRISRISASGLRPCSAASTRRARCTSSGTFLTVIEAMMADNLECFG
jgi:hypothetical protein